MYTELHARSAFSFLEGSSLPESLIARCAELNMSAMALLDRDGVYGAPADQPLLTATRSLLRCSYVDDVKKASSSQTESSFDA